MIKNYYIISSTRNFKLIVNKIAKKLTATARFYPQRAFIGTAFEFLHVTNKDEFYFLGIEAAIMLPESATPEAAMLASRLSSRMRIYSSIDDFVSHIFPPRHLAGFIFNKELKSIFMWPGADNFMPLIGNYTHELSKPTFNEMAKASFTLAQLHWQLLAIRPPVEDLWSTSHYHVAYATTEATALPGAMAIPYEYYEDMPDASFKWALDISEIVEILEREQRSIAKAWVDEANYISTEAYQELLKRRKNA